MKKLLPAGVICLALFVGLLLIASSSDDEAAPQPPSKWQTIFKGRGGVIADGPRGSVLAGIPKEAGGSTTIQINDTYYENTECRLVAVDKRGKIHIGKQTTELDAQKKLRLTKAVFADLKLAEIAEFRLQIRPCKRDTRPRVSTQPAMQPGEEWGEPVESLQMSIGAIKTSYKADENPEFCVKLRNAGEADLMLNLGFMLANGKKQYPTAIRLLITDRLGTKRELHLMGPGVVAGRMDDFIVPLPVGASYALRVSLKDYWCPDTKEFRIELPEGQYGIAAIYEGKGAELVNSGMEGIRLMSFWTGRLTSNTAAFTIENNVREKLSGEVHEPPWGEPVEGVQVQLVPLRDPAVWPHDEPPQLRAYVYYLEASKARVAHRRRQERGRIIFDGQWYEQRWDRVRLFRRGDRGGGTPYDYTVFSLRGDWHAEKGGGLLRLTPGKHTLCVAFEVIVKGSQRVFTVVSNPVEIEIQPATQAH